MGKVLVLYYSKDGNTAKIAKYVVEGTNQITNIEVLSKSILEAAYEDLYWCDGIPVGSPTH